MRVADGSNSCSSSTRFGPPLTFGHAVSLPPGRFRLATSPSSTGSTATPKRIGIVAVAAFAAKLEGVPRALQSRRPDGEPVQPQAPAAGRCGPPPRIFDLHVPALDIACLFQPLIRRRACVTAAGLSEEEQDQR
jgi:hypothetical protein